MSPTLRRRSTSQENYAIPLVDADDRRGRKPPDFYARRTEESVSLIDALRGVEYNRKVAGRTVMLSPCTHCTRSHVRHSRTFRRTPTTPEWPYGLSISTLLAIYATTLKTALLFSVGQGKL